MQSFEKMIETIVLSHFGQVPKFIKRIEVGICNEVYNVGLEDKEIIIRLSPYNKFLMGSRDHIPKLKAVAIKVPDILAEDYSRTVVPLAYQIQTKIEGQDLIKVIETLTDDQLKKIAKEIANIFSKTKTFPVDDKFGLIWGGGETEISDTWTQRMRLWIDDSIERGKKTGVIDDSIIKVAENLYTKYKSYFDSIKPTAYFGDISSKNVMINNGAFSGLVDLDGLTQGDPLEAIGRIKLSWLGTPYGETYTNAIMNEMDLDEEQRKLVTMYALLNQISWLCENGIEYNQNTKSVVDREKEYKDKQIIKVLAAKLQLL